MNKNAKKWIKALRSGKYNQARGLLREVTDDGEVTYCCLGVACDLYAKEHRLSWEEKDVRYFEGDTQTKYSLLGERFSLPEEVAEWLGMNPGGEFTFKDGRSSDLVTQNDDEKKSFKQIANIIEREPKGLFKS